MAQIIDGKWIAQQVREEIRVEIERFKAASGVTPGLATVLVGDDAASATYVRSKRKACAEVGIASFPYELPASVTQDELLRLVRELSARREVHGILVQLPLPAHLNSDAIIDAIDPDKDVDGLHPWNQARLVLGRPGLRPCTPLGCMRLIASTGVEVKGARAVVVGRSALVGKPVALLLLEQHATLTICHSRTRDLGTEIARAEIVIAAIGRARLIQGEWIRPGAVVIDVGINRDADGKLTGDVDFAAAKERAGHITPVPGGVGPMTVAMLLQNTLSAARLQTTSRR